MSLQYEPSSYTAGGAERTHSAPETLQGYLAQKKQPPPPRTAIGPLAEAYSRVLGGGIFL